MLGLIRARARSLTIFLERYEPWLAPACAMALLLYPNPFVVPAAVVGSTPSIARLLATGRPWPATAFDLPLALLTVGALLGATAGLSAEGVALRLYGLLAGLMLFSAIMKHTSSARQFRLITLGALALATLGTLVLVGIVAPFLRLERTPPLAAIAQASEWSGLNPGIADEDALLRRFRLRASGVGALADVGLAILFAVSLGVRSWRWRLAMVPLALVFGAAVFATDNRGAMLAGAMTLATLAAFWRPVLIPLIPLAAVGMLALLEAGAIEKGLDSRTLGQRFWFWENSLYLAREMPLTGAGLGTESVQLAYQSYFQPVYPNFSHAHNIYLQGLLEQGVLGLVGLVWLTGATLWVGWWMMRNRAIGPSADRWRWTGGLAGLGAALALFSTGMSEITAISTFGSALLLASLGLLAAAAGSAHGDPKPVSSPLLSMARKRSLMLAITGVVVLLALLAPTGFGARVLASGLMNAGASELNRALLSEDTTKSERPTQLGRAIWLLRAAESLDPSNPSVPRNLAIALDASEDPRRGRAAADRARGLTGPADRRGMFQVGRAYAAAGVWSEAIRAWESAESGPQLVSLGHRLIRSRNWDQAIAAYRAAAMVQPQSRGAYDGIVRAARGREDGVERALAELGSLATRGGENAFFAELETARVLRAEGRPNEALNALDRAERIRRGVDLDVERAAALIQTGRPRDAERLLQTVMADRPDEPEHYYWMAAALAAQGQHRAAVETSKDGLRMAGPARRPPRALLLAQMGESYLAMRLPDEALEAFEEGLLVSPDDPRLQEGAERARVRRVAGDR